MIEKQIFHTVVNWELEDDWTWAVCWKDVPVCFCSKEEHAKGIAEALDNYKPYFVKIKDVPLSIMGGVIYEIEDDKSK